jgi:IclR family KDG regulon transcriptional repressor
MKVQSIDRAFDILELLSREHEGLSLTEVGKRLSLPPSTVFRLLSVLKERNYIEKNEMTNVYRLGLEFIELTSMYLNNIELKTEAQPYLRRLAKLTGQVVFLATEQDDDVVYIDKVEQFNEIRKYCFIGQRRPLYCTALGKALLSGFSDDYIEKLYDGKTLEALTFNTITSLPELLGEVRKTRQRGYAIDDEEVELGLRCVSSPIFDYRNIVIAAVSTSWDLNAHQQADMYRNADLVQETAFLISKRMGYRDPKMVNRGQTQ